MKLVWNCLTLQCRMEKTYKTYPAGAFTDTDRRMMRRALQLASHGRGSVSPNPMVGAVIAAPDGRIIGEGWHRRFGEGHAEINAVASVCDEDMCLLPLSTIYVTLEPCSHYGKTPPCARLLIDRGLKRVVVACTDPNPRVSGRGIAMLREAGVEVLTGLYEVEARELNEKFITAQELRRPFVTLKWARSADGWLDCERRQEEESPFRFSTPLGAVLVHRQRALHDAIVVGSGTAIADRPSLSCRLWPGRDPLPVIADRRGRTGDCCLENMVRKPLITAAGDVPSLLRELYRGGVSSVLVEGGAGILDSFIASGCWDRAREEVSPEILDVRGRGNAPQMEAKADRSFVCGRNIINIYENRK